MFMGKVSPPPGTERTLHETAFHAAARPMLYLALARTLSDKLATVRRSRAA